ncbi:hypothetical protein HGM15179_008407 [Zosterops borbonicus]|uniref:Uncharacterized protein n=1 Tax=Zosterops borbonicus TaxID=364589 RepID=A0A8K1LLU5_9PASS|nr:hypothetical protein HGM15179_008407 [Zosterops borbonicus]
MTEGGDPCPLLNTVETHLECWVLFWASQHKKDMDILDQNSNDKWIKSLLIAVEQLLREEKAVEEPIWNSSLRISGSGRENPAATQRGEDSSTEVHVMAHIDAHKYISTLKAASIKITAGVKDMPLAFNVNEFSGINLASGDPFNSTVRPQLLGYPKSLGIFLDKNYDLGIP